MDKVGYSRKMDDESWNSISNGRSADAHSHCRRKECANLLVYSDWIPSELQCNLWNERL